MNQFLRFFLCLGILTLAACDKSDGGGGESPSAPVTQKANNQGQPANRANGANLDNVITDCAEGIKIAQPLVEKTRLAILHVFGYVQEYFDLKDVSSSLDQLQLALDSNYESKSEKVQICKTNLSSSVIPKLDKTYNAIYAVYGKVQETVDLQKASNALKKVLDDTVN